MCFNQPTSAVFVLLGLLAASYVWYKSKNPHLTIGILYFVAMELLQFVQYFWIDQCDNAVNQALTVVGFLHICFQPYFTHLMSGAFVKKSADKYALIRRLCLLQGVWMFSRWLLASNEPPAEYTEWLRGDKLCTLYGEYHIAWSVPLLAPTYFTPSNAIHFFMMFAPFIALGRETIVFGLVLFLTGPLLSWFITPNLFEQAAIWCFFSIAQICVLVVLVQLRFGGNWPQWGVSRSSSNIAVTDKKRA